MNGFVLGTWSKRSLADDTRREPSESAGFAVAHNVGSREAVDEAIERLVQFGGALLRPADAPPHGGYRGYVADPDGHAWEISWNPGFSISPEGHVTFGL